MMRTEYLFSTGIMENRKGGFNNREKEALSGGRDEGDLK